MIQYYKSAYGLALLLRVSGSAVYRSCIPAMISVALTVVFRKIRCAYDCLDEENEENKDHLDHPYAIGILISSLTFLLVFRVQQGYARYWEAASATHHCLSKWMDASIHTAAFHMQCSHYDKIKPPSFFEHPELNGMYLTRARERYAAVQVSETQRIYNRSVDKSIEQVSTFASERRNKAFKSAKYTAPARRSPLKSRHESEMHNDNLDCPTPLEGRERLDGNWGKLFDDGKATFFNPKDPLRNDPCGFAGIQGGHTPPLFLQELAHLASLLSAVALSTLRNDIEGAESPLDICEPGSPWPAVDPYKDKSKQQSGFKFSFFQKVKWFLGNSRTPLERTKYNASRPLPVIGGVSAGEIRFLQLARGPYAKTQLCWYWLSEFITREHLAGSLGKVGPPIISRIIQFLGDGMIHYNHARKIMFIPFPFPHAQLSVVYVLVAIPTVAFLVNQYANELWLACVLAFLTVLCLSGIHETARELENPFRQVPNELPLVTFQAQFNEALITMYSGYHPDHFWEEEACSFSSSSMPSVDEIPLAETPPMDAKPQPEMPRPEFQRGIQSLFEKMKREMEEQKVEMARQKHEIGLLQSKLKKSEDAVQNGGIVETNKDANLRR